MRKFVIIIFIVFLLAFDMGSKFFMVMYLSYEGCYAGSPCILKGPIEDSTRPIEYCFQDVHTGEDFYEVVYTDIYYPLIGDYIGWKISYNPGIAFSFPIHGPLLQIITLIILLGLIIYYIREEYLKNSRLLDVGYSLILGGAISHAFERVFIGHVVDFISVKYFAILNFADIFISIGVLLLIIAYVREHRKHR